MIFLIKSIWRPHVVPIGSHWTFAIFAAEIQNRNVTSGFAAVCEASMQWRCQALGGSRKEQRLGDRSLKVKASITEGYHDDDDDDDDADDYW